MLKNFTVNIEPPVLVGGLGQGGSMDTFAMKFGKRWLRTPIKGVFYIGVNGMQFTLRGNEVAYYDFALLTEFKKLFTDNPGAIAGNAEYFNLDEKSKYSAIDIIKFIDNI